MNRYQTPPELAVIFVDKAYRRWIKFHMEPNNTTFALDRERSITGKQSLGSACRDNPHRLPSLIDIGCGSGILGAAALICGYTSSVKFIDSCPLMTSTCEKNMQNLSEFDKTSSILGEEKNQENPIVSTGNKVGGTKLFSNPKGVIHLDSSCRGSNMTNHEMNLISCYVESTMDCEELPTISHIFNKEMNWHVENIHIRSSTPIDVCIGTHRDDHTTNSPVKGRMTRPEELGVSSKNRHEKAFVISNPPWGFQNRGVDRPILKYISRLMETGRFYASFLIHSNRANHIPALFSGPHLSTHRIMKDCDFDLPATYHFHYKKWVSCYNTATPPNYKEMMKKTKCSCWLIAHRP